MCSNCAADDFNNPPLTVSTTEFRDVALRPIIRFGQYLARSMGMLWTHAGRSQAGLRRGRRLIEMGLAPALGIVQTGPASSPTD